MCLTCIVTDEAKVDYKKHDIFEQQLLLRKVFGHLPRTVTPDLWRNGLSLYLQVFACLESTCQRHQLTIEQHRLSVQRMSKTPSAQPLKVPATPSKAAETDKDKTPVANKQSAPSKLGTIAPKDISSPHELTAFVSPRYQSAHNLLTLGLGRNSSGAIGFQVRRDVVTDLRTEYVKIGRLQSCFVTIHSFLSQ